MYDDVSNIRSSLFGKGREERVLGSLGFVRFVMHTFGEDREGVARRFKDRQIRPIVNSVRELKLPRQRCIATKAYL